VVVGAARELLSEGTESSSHSKKVTLLAQDNL
jgi:hypothetical protein